jgi:hypothetical protein
MHPASQPEDLMSDHTKQPQDELSQEELQAQEGAELPDRYAFTLKTPNCAAPNPGPLAANVLSDNSVAYANAEQNAPITQNT